jgi:hypothetical protein
MQAPAAAKIRRARFVGEIELPRVDGRTLAARAFRRRVAAYLGEFGTGHLSEADKGLILAAAAISVRVDQLQRDLIEGRPVDEDAVVRLSSEHRRLLTSLRSKAAKARPADEDSLAAHIATRYCTPVADGEAESGDLVEAAE